MVTQAQVGKSASRQKIPLRQADRHCGDRGTALAHPGAQYRNPECSRITIETAGGLEAIRIIVMCFLLIRCH